MTTWTSDELSRIDAVDELEIAPRRRDGTLRKPVPIWAVRAGDDLYVRAAYPQEVEGGLGVDRCSARWADATVQVAGRAESVLGALALSRARSRPASQAEDCQCADNRDRSADLDALELSRVLRRPRHDPTEATTGPCGKNCALELSNGLRRLPRQGTPTTKAASAWTLERRSSPLRTP